MAAPRHHARHHPQRTPRAPFTPPHAPAHKKIALDPAESSAIYDAPLLLA
ncbi:hypothetical protein ACWD26_04390 [Streptomyces sp. NPDC002787]